jgi:hypothetical protein
MTSELNGPERELERVLLGLQPSGADLDHELILLRAGQTAVRRQLRIWQASTLALLAGLGLSIFGGWHEVRKPGTLPPDSRWVAASSVKPPAPGSYAELRTRVFEHGIDALPRPETGGPTLSADDARSL